MRSKHAAVVLAVFVLATPSGHSFGGRWGGGGPVVAYSYGWPFYGAYAVPGYAFYSWPAPACRTQPAVVPSPAYPPLPRPVAPRKAEPPLAQPIPKQSLPKQSRSQQGPTIIESRSPGGAAPATDRCKVGFWNLTGGEVALKVAGKDFRLPRDRAITLELERDFAWQMSGEDAPHPVRVPLDQPFHEIILRPNLQ